MVQCFLTGWVFMITIACGSGGTADRKLVPVCPLPEQLKECSGMVLIGNDLFAGINDSGHPAELVVFSLAKKSETRVITIPGATNHDWEELTADDQYLYIGDTGNNLGTRKDLVIYRIRKDNLLSNALPLADKISFHYPEQQKFDPLKKHGFDCEAMVCAGDSLYLFTKNRNNYKTDLYRLPKTPGNYNAVHLGRFDSQGLVTGATYRSTATGNELALVGYTDKSKGYHPFVVYFSHVEGTRFFESPVKRFDFDGSEQTESILFHDDLLVYLSNESNHGEKGFVYQLSIKNKD